MNILWHKFFIIKFVIYHFIVICINEGTTMTYANITYSLGV